jgi:hypothetical protein
MATTLGWGVVNGSKLALIVAFWFGGVAQWWLARVLRLGWLARVWSGLMGIFGGHLASRMELGAFGVVLSTAMCALVLAPAMSVARTSSRRSAILLGVTIASAIVAGQGYMQVGLLFTVPAFLILVLQPRNRSRSVRREFAIAVGLALLLVAPFLVPVLHFAPNYAKFSDPDLGFAQSLEYLPLNLVIRDLEFLTSDMLSKPDNPHRTAMYVGWVSIGLAVACLRLARRKDRRWLLFLAACVLLVMLTASGVLLRLVRPLVPALAGVRHPTQIAGLAVPPVLGLAAYGLDRLWKTAWPRLRLRVWRDRGWGGVWLNPRWLLLIPLVWNLWTAYDFSRTWLHVWRLPSGMAQVLDALVTSSLQWVGPPFGEHVYVEPAIRRGLKLSPGVMTWWWRDRPFPEPYVEVSRRGPPPDSYAVGKVYGLPIYRFHSQRDYAYVQSGRQVFPCLASGIGGDLVVECSFERAGTLTVMENNWTGWYAWQDGERTQLLDGRWLQVYKPAGQQRYRFRYLPWDVPVGMLLCLIGVALGVWQWSVHSAPRGTLMGQSVGREGQ